MRAAALVLLLFGRTALADDPSDRDLVLAGAAMALPTYFLGVVMHEGSHALSAKAFGAEILEFSVLPSIRDGRFYFGYVRWQGYLTDCEKVWSLLMPKVTNAVFFGGYTLLLATDTLPENDYGRLALAVFATGQ